MDDTTHCTGCGMWLGTDCHSELVELRKKDLDVDQCKRVLENQRLQIDALRYSERDQKNNVSQILQLRRDADDRGEFVKELVDTVNDQQREIRRLRDAMCEALLKSTPAELRRCIHKALGDE
jgi:hypothetical protein